MIGAKFEFHNSEMSGVARNYQDYHEFFFATRHFYKECQEQNDLISNYATLEGLSVFTL